MCSWFGVHTIICYNSNWIEWTVLWMNYHVHSIEIDSIVLFLFYHSIHSDCFYNFDCGRLCNQLFTHIIFLQDVHEIPRLWEKVNRLVNWSAGSLLLFCVVCSIQLFHVLFLSNSQNSPSTFIWYTVNLEYFHFSTMMYVNFNCMHMLNSYQHCNSNISNWKLKMVCQLIAILLLCTIIFESSVFIVIHLYSRGHSSASDISIFSTKYLTTTHLYDER